VRATFIFANKKKKNFLGNYFVVVVVVVVSAPIEFVLSSFFAPACLNYFNVRNIPSHSI
jgi:hypothetical protein